MSSSLPFAKYKFYILPVKLDQDKLKSIQDDIASLGGTCLLTSTNASFIITGLKSPTRIQRHVVKETCPVAHISWISECVTQRQFLDPTPYKIHINIPSSSTSLFTTQLAIKSISASVPLPVAQASSSPSKIETPTAAAAAAASLADEDNTRPRQMRSWRQVYATYKQQCHMPVSKHAILHGYDLSSKKKRKKTKLRRDPSYQTTTSGESSLEQGHPWWAETSLYQTTTYACERPSPLNHPNKALVEIFEFLEHTRDLRGDSINGLSYKKAAAVLKSYPYEIKSSHEALQLKGIGKKTGRIIEDYLKTGHVSDVDLVKEDPEFKTLNLFYNIHGVGATTAREWYNKGYRTFDDVKANEHLSEDQLLGMKYYDDFLQQIPRNEVESIADEFCGLLKEYQQGCEYTVCGSYRRGKPTSGDMDILVTHPDEKVTKKLLGGLVDYLKSRGYIQDILSQSGRISKTTTTDADESDPYSSDGSGGGDDGKHYSNQNRQALCVWRSKEGDINRRLDLIVVPWCDYPIAILGWTGSRHFARSIRLWAKQQKKLKVTSHGIFRKGEKLLVNSEQHAFDILGLPYLEPSDRNC